MHHTILPLTTIATLVLLLPGQALSAPNITCEPTPRTFYMSDKQYSDTHLNIEGKLFPLMADILCSPQFCPPVGRPACHYAVQPYKRNKIHFTWKRPDAMNTACHTSNWEAIIAQCFNANPPASGGTYYVSETESYSISMTRFDGVVMMPVDDVPGTPTPDEPPTFYVADYRQPFADPQTGVSVYGVGHGDCNWLVGNTGSVPAGNIDDFTADVANVELGPGQQLPAFYYYRDQLPHFQGFTLQGKNKGVCGLDTVFEFKKVAEGKFSFTDKGVGGPVIGYCTVITDDATMHKESCTGNNGDNLGIPLEVSNVLACYATGISNYCLDHGKP